MDGPPDTGSVISVRKLRKWYDLPHSPLAALAGRGAGHLKAVDGVSFDLRPGQVLGLAGESGCGKSTTGMTALQLIRPTGGEVWFEGENLAGRSPRQLREFRRRAQIVFQNPYEALNPRLTVGESIMEPIAVHVRDAEERRRLLEQAMTRASLPVARFIGRYPHQMSGGQLQRVAIARAIALEPRFLVADEPVSMLDVSIRASVLNLFRRFARELDMAILYVSHDLSTMRHICHDVAVMYLGRIVEIGPADDVLDRPQHPYARALMAAVPLMGGRRRAPPDILETASDPVRPPTGCGFQARCPRAMPECSVSAPALRPVPAGAGLAACHLVA